MKIIITEAMRKILTIAEIPAVKALQKQFKSEDFEWEAAHAALIASRNNVSNVLKIEAEIAKNQRIHNYYGNESEESGDLDIWLRILAYDTFYGFYDIGAYLSDIWSADGKNSEEIRNHMFILEFLRKK